MKTFKEFIDDESGVDYFIVEMPVELVSEQALINEGQWVQSGKKDWMQRIDAENPSIKLQRHVHVARSKHISTKNKQVSWNQDGSKHDRGSFNSKIGALSVVQAIAHQALGLSHQVKLEESTRAGNFLVQLNESLHIKISPVLFKVRLA